MKKPKHAKGGRISNLGQFAHPPKAPAKVTRVKALPHQKGNMTPKMAGPKVPPAAVSKPRMKKA